MKLNSLFALLLLCIHASAQPAGYRMTQQEYIGKYKNDAIKDMQKTAVPASITLAQGVLESESGNSNLAREANNHFGIKCHNEWAGDSFYKDDDQKNECFRKYNTVLESFDDHSAFLRTRDRYAFLFDLKITDYKGWALGLKRAGYATNPEYAQKLIKIIEDFQLYELDNGKIDLPLLASAGNDAPKIFPRDESKQKMPVNTAAQSILHSKNNVPYVYAAKGDSYFSLANENNIMLWQALKYNDAEKTDVPHEGDIIYLMPKRAKAQEHFHIAEAGEDLRSISQQYAVKLKKLCKRNHLTREASLQPGQKILLR